MTVEELDQLALNHYEHGGDIIIECFEKHEKQAFLDKNGSGSRQEALALFTLWHESAEDIRNTAY